MHLEGVLKMQIAAETWVSVVDFAVQRKGQEVSRSKLVVIQAHVVMFGEC